jgi:hypothetical protein
MEIEILQLLHSSKLRWTKLNELLKENLPRLNNREQAEEAKNVLSPLVESTMIEVQNNAFLQLGQDMNGESSRFYDLNNLEILGRIMEKGANELASLTKRWYETENARMQFENYHKLELKARRAVVNSRIAILIAILALISPLVVWLLKYFNFWPF